MEINFKQLAEEDKEFQKYAAEIIYKVTVDFNEGLLAMLYPMYAKDIPQHVAYDTVKMMILLGGDNGPGRNRKS